MNFWEKKNPAGIFDVLAGFVLFMHGPCELVASLLGRGDLLHGVQAQMPSGTQFRQGTMVAVPAYLPAVVEPPSLPRDIEPYGVENHDGGNGGKPKGRKCPEKADFAKYGIFQHKECRSQDERHGDQE
jgi:hypothetical protein